MKARLLSITTDEGFSTKWHNLQMPEAEVLVLNLQTKNYALPESVVNMGELKAVIVTNYGFLPAELTFPNLEEMNIDYCNDLIELPAEVCDLSKLKKLNVTSCHELSVLPEGIGKLKNLELLRLRSCTELSKLPTSMKNLGKVNFLDISYCFSIKVLPEDIGEMSSLRKINMRQCSRLQELPPSVKGLVQLKEVVCDEETKYLWESFSSYLKNVSIIVAKENINLNWLHMTR
ncbi:hypothetical protein ACFXTN_025279 [Malus domestica]